MGRIGGVVTGKVISVKDPEGQGRVQVSFPWMGGQNEGYWSPVATMMSGGGRGSWFMPVEGDEVLVAFEYGDPERPYIVGALWNGVSVAPRLGYSASGGLEAVAAAGGANPRPIQVIPNEIAGNFIKRIVTTSGHHIQFDDTNGSESIVVATANGQRIQLMDKCNETGGRQMLCLSTDGDIFLNAPNGRVHVRSKFFSREVG